MYFLPTHGENFGHSIVEALSAGKPIIISNSTPWRDLRMQNIGWDIPLENEGQFRKVIEYSATMNNLQYQRMVDAVERYMDAKAINDESIHSTIMMLSSVVSSREPKQKSK